MPFGLRITLVRGQLSPKQVEIWRQLQDSNAALASPCFAPEFFQAVASVRSDAEAALVEKGRGVVAIFPFQRKNRFVGVPAGGIVSDYQGFICGPDFSCEPVEILRACKLAAWDFDRLIASQDFFTHHHRFCEPSARIDLSRGYHAYAAEKRAAGTRQIADCEYGIRRMEREIGPLHVVPHSSDPKLLAQVLAWKSEQYRRSGWPDLFATDWGRALVQGIHGLRSPSFAGVLSLLYAGQHLVAGHMGMSSRTIWHYWFPAYDTRFAKYSPGMILLLKMAQHAEELGFDTIDMGTGIGLYKKRLMNACVPVAEGSVEAPSCLRVLRSMRRQLKSILRPLVARITPSGCTADSKVGDT